LKLKSGGEQTLKEIIEELLKTYKLDEGVNEARLIGSWEKTAGPLIYKHTREMYIKRRKLYLKLDSPALKHELSFAKSKLIKALNKAASKEVIDDIIFL